MITDLLGTPTDEDTSRLTSSPLLKKIAAGCKPRALDKLYHLSPMASHEVVHLLYQMLVFNPVSVFFVSMLASY